MRHGQRSWDTARTLGAARHAMAPLTITADDDQIYMVDVDLADPVENLKVGARAGARPHERACARERESGDGLAGGRLEPQLLPQLPRRFARWNAALAGARSWVYARASCDRRSATQTSPPHAAAD